MEAGKQREVRRVKGILRYEAEFREPRLFVYLRTDAKGGPKCNEFHLAQTSVFLYP